MLDNLKSHWKHYATVALATVIALGSCYRVGQKEAVRQDRIGTSLLRLSSGRLPAVGVGHGVQRPVVRHATPSVNKPDAPEAVRAPYIPNESPVQVVPADPSKPLNAKIEYRRWGFCHAPGLELTIVPLGMGVDVKWFYAGRFGSTIGANYLKFFGEESASPTIALSYHFSAQTFKNTDLVVGWSPLGKFPAYAGFRLGF